MRRGHSMTRQVCCWRGNSIACHAVFLTIKFPAFRKKPYSFLLTVPQLSKLHVPDDIPTTDIRNNQTYIFFFVERLPRTLKYPMVWHQFRFTFGSFALQPWPYLRTGHRGPGPGRQISRGGILKKNRDWNKVWGKKRLSTREKFKGDLYWKQCWYHSATEFSRYDVTGARRSWGYCLLAASVIRGFGSVVLVIFAFILYPRDTL